MTPCDADGGSRPDDAVEQAHIRDAHGEERDGETTKGRRPRWAPFVLSSRREGGRACGGQGQLVGHAKATPAAWVVRCPVGARAQASEWAPLLQPAGHARESANTRERGGSRRRSGPALQCRHRLSVGEARSDTRPVELLPSNAAQEWPHTSGRLSSPRFFFTPSVRGAYGGEPRVWRIPSAPRERPTANHHQQQDRGMTSSRLSMGGRVGLGKKSRTTGRAIAVNTPAGAAEDRGTNHDDAKQRATCVAPSQSRAGASATPTTTTRWREGSEERDELQTRVSVAGCRLDKPFDGFWCHTAS